MVKPLFYVAQNKFWPGQMRRFHSEQFLALLRVEENPKGNHQALDVKGERHTTGSLKSTQAVAVRGECVTTAPPRTTLVIASISVEIE